MKKIYNPTESMVKITIKGIDYSVEASASTIEAPEIADEWKRTHEFLQVSDVDLTEKEEIKVIAEEAKEVVKEEKVSGDKPKDLPKEVKKESIIKKAVKAVSKK